MWRRISGWISGFSKRSAKLSALIFITLSITTLVGFALHYEIASDIEDQTWDWRVRWLAGYEKPDPNIKIIMIDQTSLDRRAEEEGQYWPWPRSLYNPVLYYLKEAGAKAVAFDMLFTEESNYVKDDRKFAEAILGSIPVVSAVALRGTDASVDPRRLDLFRKKQLDENKITKFEDYYLAPHKRNDFQSITLPITDLLESSPYLGNVTASADSDKIYRHTTVGGYIAGIPVLNLPFSLFHAGNKERDLSKQLTADTDNDGKLLVRFMGQAGAYKSYSIDAIIQSWVQHSSGENPQVPLSDFNDAYVFIGTNALGLFDLRPTPLSGNYPGVEFNATILDNILHDRFMHSVANPLAAVGASVLILIVSYISIFTIRNRDKIILLSLALICFVGAVFYAASVGWWMPLVNPFAGAVLAVLSSLAFLYELEGRQRRFIKSAFEYYVSPEVINRIVVDPAQLTLGGERRELTIFFSDIAGFTSISETMEPEKLVSFLNEFLSEMTDIILKSGGTIDKYEGDAIIAFWNAPLDVPEHRLCGVKAAMDCQRRLYEMQEHFKELYGVGVKIRIGLNTGSVTVGNFGSATRFNYTMIGDAVNLASRLEGANKVFASKILVSQATRSGVEEKFRWRKLGDLTVVGKKEVVSAYEPLDNLLHREILDKLEEYQRGIALFEAGKLEEALVIFKSLKEIDAVSASYVNRIETIKNAGQSNENRSPVWNLTDK